MGPAATAKCPYLLRRVVVWEEANEEPMVRLTNHRLFAATTIAALCRDRWESEVFFKTLKLHLKLKTLVGTSENALRIPLGTARIALLLLNGLPHLSPRSWSFSNRAARLRLNLFTYRDLLPWRQEPFGPPAPIPAAAPVQLHFSLPGFGPP